MEPDTIYLLVFVDVELYGYQANPEVQPSFF